MICHSRLYLFTKQIKAATFAKQHTYLAHKDAARKAERNREHTIKKFERCYQFFVYWTIYPYITFFAVKS